MAAHDCPYYDPSYKGCESCPGQFSIKMPDDTVVTLCRAGEQYLRTLLENPRIPIYPTPFPAPERKAS